MSDRKPYNDRAGYVASLRSAKGRGWVVIYEATAAGIDADERYVTVCESHGEMIASRGLPGARNAMKNPAMFCSVCAGVHE